MDSYEIFFSSAFSPQGWLRYDLRSTLPLVLYSCPPHFESESTEVAQYVHRTSSLLVCDLGMHKVMEDQIASHLAKVSFYTKRFCQLQEFELSRVSWSRSFLLSYLVMNDPYWALDYGDFLSSCRLLTQRPLLWTHTRAADHQLDLSLHYKSSSLSTNATCWFWLPEAYFQIWRDCSLNEIVLHTMNVKVDESKQPMNLVSLYWTTNVCCWNLMVLSFTFVGLIESQIEVLQSLHSQTHQMKSWLLAHSTRNQTL